MFGFSKRFLGKIGGLMADAFRWGRLGDATSDFNPPARSGDSEISSSRDLMDRRGRESYLNSPVIKKATHLLRDLVVGRGLNAFSDPIDSSFGWDLQARPEADLNRSLDYALQSDEAFSDWAEDPDQCDVTGKQGWFSMLGMLITENCGVGESLLIRSERGKGRVPLQFQITEKDQIDATRALPEYGSRVVEGFELDDQGREIGVWLYDVHPHDSLTYAVGASWKSQFIPARRYTHIFKPYRPSQSIGAPWLHAMAQPTIDMESFTESELASAIKAAMHVLALYTEDKNSAALGMTVDPVTGATSRPQVRMGRNPKAVFLGKDEKLELLKNERPNSNALPFLQHLLGLSAGAVDLSPYTLSGDFSNTNYGGFRGAMNLEHLQIAPIQDWLGRAAVLPVRYEFNSMLVGSGGLPSISAKEFSRERRRLQRFDVVGPGRFFLDPDKEIDAAISTMRAGMGTLKQWCALQGLHWIKVLRQIALENKIAAAMGVVLDHSKGNGGERLSSSREAEQSGQTEQGADV